MSAVQQTCDRLNMHPSGLNIHPSQSLALRCAHAADRAGSQEAVASDVSAEAACENLHEPFPRKTFRWSKT